MKQTTRGTTTSRGLVGNDQQNLLGYSFPPNLLHRMCCGMRQRWIGSWAMQP